MKKSLLALAVLGAFAASAQAQTSVTIGGVVQADVKSYKVDDVTAVGRVAKRETRVDDDYTSRFWLTGSEDLGGGNSAIFYVENRFNTDVNSTAPGDGNGLSNGETYLGLKGAWGQGTIGKHTMMDGEGAVTERGGNGTPALPVPMYGTKSILGFVGNTSLTTTRVLNSVMYKTPNLGGFSGSIGVGASGSNANEGVIGSNPTGAAEDYSKGHQLFLKGNYTNGPIYVNLAYWATEAEGLPVFSGTLAAPIPLTAANADQRQIRLSGSYAFPFGLKVGLQYDRARLENVGRNAAGTGGVDITRNAWEVPVSYTFGPNTILASFTKANDFSNADNTGAKMYVLGYDYALSKRTNVGVFYSKLKNDTAGLYQPYKSGTSSNGSVLLSGESASILALGVKHTF